MEPEKRQTVTLKANGKEYPFYKDGNDPELHESILLELNKHFKASSVEKYEDASINATLAKAVSKHIKGNGRISEHQWSRVQVDVNKRMKALYGPYVNVLRKKDKFWFNLSVAFKTDLGRLYQSRKVLNLFVTTHAIERFAEREELDDPWMIGSKIEFKRMYGTAPTTWDLMDAALGCSIFYTRRGNTYYLYLGIGALVVESLSETVCVGKTYLAEKMLPVGGWRYVPGGILMVGDFLSNVSESTEAKHPQCHEQGKEEQKVANGGCT